MPLDYKKLDTLLDEIETELESPVATHLVSSLLHLVSALRSGLRHAAAADYARAQKADDERDAPPTPRDASAAPAASEEKGPGDAPPLMPEIAIQHVVEPGKSATGGAKREARRGNR